MAGVAADEARGIASDAILVGGAWQDELVQGWSSYPFLRAGLRKRQGRDAGGSQVKAGGLARPDCADSCAHLRKAWPEQESFLSHGERLTCRFPRVWRSIRRGRLRVDGKEFSIGERERGVTSAAQWGRLARQFATTEIRLPPVEAQDARPESEEVPTI